MRASRPAPSTPTSPAPRGPVSSARARTATARIVVDEQRRVLIGATFTGPEVADSLHAATIAIVGEVPLDRLIHAIPAFPTRSEVWLQLLDDWMP